MKFGIVTLLILLSSMAAANGQLYMYFVNALQDLMKNPSLLKDSGAKQPAPQTPDADVALDGGMLWKAGKDVEKLIKVTESFSNLFPSSSSASSSTSFSSSSSTPSVTSSSSSTSTSTSTSSAPSSVDEIKPTQPKTSLDIVEKPQANENQLETIQLQPQVQPQPQQIQPVQSPQPSITIPEGMQVQPVQSPQPSITIPEGMQIQPVQSPQPTITIPEGMSAREYLKTVPHLKYHSGEELSSNLRQRYFARQRRI